MILSRRDSLSSIFASLHPHATLTRQKTVEVRTPSDCHPITACRICGGASLEQVCSLGEVPLANALASSPDEGTQQSRYPLELVWCGSCSLLQLAHTVAPEVLFGSYPYLPSLSSTYLAHFDAFVAFCIREWNLSPHSLVLDIGSNDGSLLAAFERERMRVLGIDPASHIARIAQGRGIETLPMFFDEKLATSLASQGIRPHLITTTNTLAHIHDLRGFARGIRTLLAPDGVFAAQFPSLLDLLATVAFDTIYHEHQSYFSLAALQRLFEGADLTLFDAWRTSIHGGSLRIAVCRSGVRPVHEHVEQLLAEEEAARLRTIHPYYAFAQSIEERRLAIRATVLTVKHGGTRIVGFGMPGKGTILLHVCELAEDVLTCIVDSTPLKQGKYAPGTSIPILAEEALAEEQPTHILVLAWNFFEEIARKHKWFKARGGKFIIPFPELRIV